jgi:hypothetical protein
VDWSCFFSALPIPVMLPALAADLSVFSVECSATVIPIECSVTVIPIECSVTVIPKWQVVFHRNSAAAPARPGGARIT